MSALRAASLPEAEWHPSSDDPIHPAVQVTVGATSGYMYSHLIDKLREYPIPEIRLPRADGEERLLDVGCGWGRWTAAAARKGYKSLRSIPISGSFSPPERLYSSSDLRLILSMPTRDFFRSNGAVSIAFFPTASSSTSASPMPVRHSPR